MKRVKQNRENSNIVDKITLT